MSEAPAPDRPQFVVGIGASAGGLEALASLIASLTLDSMSFVVIQHLSPDHESALPTLLSRSSSVVSVVAATDGTLLEANHVYVIPPNADLGILDGRMQVISPPTLPHPRLPIDFFFRSLAADQGARAIGVVLSGTGSDGTLGLKSNQARRAASPSRRIRRRRRYDGMPRAALDSGWRRLLGHAAEDRRRADDARHAPVSRRAPAERSDAERRRPGQDPPAHPRRPSATT